MKIQSSSLSSAVQGFWEVRMVWGQLSLVSASPWGSCSCSRRGGRHLGRTLLALLGFGSSPGTSPGSQSVENKPHGQFLSSTWRVLSISSLSRLAGTPKSTQTKYFEGNLAFLHWSLSSPAWFPKAAFVFCCFHHIKWSNSEFCLVFF